MTDSDVQDPIRRILGGTPDQPILTFERRYRTDPRDLWQAITDPERLGRWFGRLEGPAHAVGMAAVGKSCWARWPAS